VIVDREIERGGWRGELEAITDQERGGDARIRRVATREIDRGRRVVDTGDAMASTREPDRDLATTAAKIERIAGGRRERGGEEVIDGIVRALVVDRARKIVPAATTEPGDLSIRGLVVVIRAQDIPSIASAIIAINFCASSFSTFALMNS